LGRRLRWGRPEEAALRRWRQWRGGQWGDGGDGAVGREMQRPFIERGLGGDGVVTAVIPPYYGALAGAHTAPRRRGRGASVGGKASGGGAYGGARPQAEEGVGRRAGCGCRGPAGA
jgi:hypothetical protein